MRGTVGLWSLGNADRALGLCRRSGVHFLSQAPLWVVPGRGRSYSSQGERVGGTSTETGGGREYTYPLVLALASGAGVRILKRRYRIMRTDPGRLEQGGRQHGSEWGLWVSNS